MSSLFSNKKTFNHDICNWDTSNVIDMYQMFVNTPFNQNITGWDVGNVTNTIRMFSREGAFNQDIREWNINKVNEAASGFIRMFFNATEIQKSIADGGLGAPETPNKSTRWFDNYP